MTSHRYLRVTFATLVAGALALVPMAPAAATGADGPAPRVSVRTLTIAGSARALDVTTTAATVRARVQVKDKDKTFDPDSVALTVKERASGSQVATSTVAARRVGRSRVVTNWHATITVPAASVPAGSTATYCITLVTVADASPLVPPVTARANGLPGRDCFTVTNSTPTG